MQDEPAAAPRALIADDEPLLRERLALLLARVWPQLQVVAQARNGREAIERFDEHEPELAFLDVQMPGIDGIEAARSLQGRTLIVFVTAFERYAVEAFEQGAVDYLVKPFDEARLALCVQRLQERLRLRQAATRAASSASPVEPDLTPWLDQLAARLRPAQTLAAGSGPLQWIKASVGPAVKLIPVDEVIYLKSDEKYTLVVWSGGEALIRKPIRELADELDRLRFVQVHRSVIVNLHHVAQVVRGANETADVHLRGRTETLPVSRSYLHHFRQM
ncbi:MAG: response regulator transcription factor [Rubrivivax sp.]|nr:response regulator transcription factor [Rubrivivax sp.]